MRTGEAFVEAPSRAPLLAVVFVPNPMVAERDGTPGGLSLLERQLKQLDRLGVGAIWLLVPEGQREPAVPSGHEPERLVRVPSVPGGLVPALVAAAELLPAECLAASADRLVDPRVVRALVGRPESTFASVDGVAAEPLAWVYASDVRRHGSALAAAAARLPLAEVERYAPELRGEVEPYILTVATAAERRSAWRVLLTHVQKQALDLPGRYFDTPFENFLVRRLAPTTITPNQITLLTLALAAVVAFLFLHGWLRIGVGLALVVGVLDGVDGKLARLKLATSKLGELEHVGDFFYENAWYLALAAHLQALTQSAHLWLAGLALVALDLADSLLYLVVRRHTGAMLDELSTFDRRFRAVAGRRNVYVAIFVVGFFAGHARLAFEWAVLWASVTVGVHATRTAWVVATVPRVNSVSSTSPGTVPPA